MLLVGTRQNVDETMRQGKKDVVGNAPRVRLDNIKGKIAQIVIGSKQLKGYFIIGIFS
jgi:hypothetical protein